MKDVAEMTYEEHIEMEDNLDVKVKDWYLENYPTDECGHYLSDTATFVGMYTTLAMHKDIYDYIGEGDSVIRERLFSHLCDILDMDYDEIYDLWVKAG